MRVVLVTQNWPYPPTSGESVIVYNLINQLARKHDIHLISLEDNTSAVQSISQIASSTRIYTPRKKSFGGYLATIWRPYPYGIYAGTHSFVGFKLKELITQYNPDLVQFCSLGLSLYREFVPSKFPLILLAADSLSLVMQRLALNESNFFRRMHYKLNCRRAKALERNVYPLFDTVIMVSEVDAQVLRSSSPSTKVHIINIGVDTEYFYRKKEISNQKNIGIVGNFGYVPNEKAALRLFQDILPGLKPIYPNVKAYAIGLNPTGRMRTLGKKNDSIVITGYVDDIRTYLEKITVFVAFLESGGGIKNKVLEAMSMELPVVGTRIAFEGIQGKDGEHFFVVDTVDEAVRVIRRLFLDRELRLTVGKKARRLVVEKYSWLSKAEDYETLWQEVVLSKSVTLKRGS